jgi:hypothetical protein
MKMKWMGFALAMLMVAWTTKSWSADDSGYVTNGGFEVASTEDPTVPAGWFPFFSKNKGIELSQTAPKSGNNCMKMSVQDVANGSQGIAQIIPVDDGATYSFTVHVINNNENPLAKGAYGMLGIEWKNSDGKEISRTTSTEWDMSLSRTRWESINVTEKAPRDAKTAAFAISFFDGDKGGSGSCFVDDARVEMKK